MVIALKYRYVPSHFEHEDARPLLMEPGGQALHEVASE